MFYLLIASVLTDGMSCQCITRMFGLVILGLVLNALIVGPFVALSIVALTNIYQTLDGKREHGAIPEDLFWRICSEASNSNNTVPPVRD